MTIGREGLSDKQHLAKAVAPVEKPFFSIILAVFNGRSYVARAVESIKAQTCGAWELLLVDDGSTDGTAAVCRELARGDERLKLTVLPQHAGVNQARNQVLGLARGRYVAFVDADDYVDRSALATVYQFLQAQPVQVLKCGFDEEYYDSQEQLLGVKKLRPEPGVYQAPLADLADLLFAPDKIHLFGFLWNGFYARELLTKLQAQLPTEFHFGMDFIFNLDLCSQAESLAYLPYGGYHYCKRGAESLSSQKQSKYFAVQLCKVQAALDCFPEWARSDGAGYQNFLWKWYVRSVYSQGCRKLVVAGREAAVQELQTLYGSDLFRKFQTQEFKTLGWRQQFLIELLQAKRTGFIIVLCYVMVGVQEYAPMLFARIKD
jgi:glycosyltransferase involved in cell wall biosynthesis